MVIPIAHDFACAWCYIGMYQVRELRSEFDVSFDWRGYELYPEGMDFPEASLAPAVASNRPKTPSRYSLALAAQRITLPKIDRPINVRSHDALAAVEFAKEAGDPNGLVERIYVAYWEEGIDISVLGNLILLSEPFVNDTSKLTSCIVDKTYSDRIVPFDEGAYAMGVYNVPTFWIGDERYAEQPITVLRRAITEVLASA